jgi:hypothetical protein
MPSDCIICVGDKIVKRVLSKDIKEEPFFYCCKNKELTRFSSCYIMERFTVYPCMRLFDKKYMFRRNDVF